MGVIVKFHKVTLFRGQTLDFKGMYRRYGNIWKYTLYLPKIASHTICPLSRDVAILHVSEIQCFFRRRKLVPFVQTSYSLHWHHSISTNADMLHGQRLIEVEGRIEHNRPTTSKMCNTPQQAKTTLHKKAGVILTNDRWSVTNKK